MAQYSPEALASIRHAYVHTDQPMRLIANDHGIGITTLQTIVERQKWPKRSQRQRGHPPAMPVLEQARLLEERMREMARAPQETPIRLASPATLPLAGEGREEESGGGREQDAADHAQADLRPMIDLLERDTRAALEELHAERKQREGQPRQRGEGEVLSRRLADLSLAVQRIERMRRGKFDDPPPPSPKPVDEDDDEIPQDLDAFRLRLARKIEAFVASREDDEDAAEDDGPRDGEAGP